jgi:hypothetical protein
MTRTGFCWRFVVMRFRCSPAIKIATTQPKPACAGSSPAIEIAAIQPKPACAGSSPAIKIAATQAKPACAGSRSPQSAQADLVCVAAILIARLPENEQHHSDLKRVNLPRHHPIAPALDPPFLNSTQRSGVEFKRKRSQGSGGEQRETKRSVLLRGAWGEPRTSGVKGRLVCLNP